MTWMGKYGSMVRLRGVSSLTRVGGVGYATAATVDGGRRAQQVRTLREWKLSTTAFATPQDLATLAQIADGVLGPGPHVFVPADAPYVNLLPPSATRLDTAPSGWTRTGPRTTIDGVWVGAWLTSGPTPAAVLLPGKALALAGQPLTASAYVQGAGAKIIAYVRDAAGTVIQSATSNAAVGAATQRLTVTLTPTSATTAYATIAIVPATQTVVGAPSVTLTDRAYPWGEGRACDAAVLTAGTHSLQLADPGASFHGRLEGLSDLTVAEVTA